jgi:hypothetical protein
VGHNVVVDTLHGKNLFLNQEGPNVQNNVIGKTAWNPSDQQETQFILELSPGVPPWKQKCFKIPTTVNGVVIRSKNDSLPWSHRNTIITKNLHSTRIINSSSKVQHNVIILGDSHLKGCVVKLRNELSATFKVSGMIRPGAGSELIVNSSVEDLLNLHLQDVIVLNTGANDVYRNGKGLALTQITKFIQRNYGSNIIITDIPQRYELSPSSCINLEIEEFNSKLKENITIYNHVSLLETNLKENVSGAGSALEFFRKVFSSETPIASN